MCSKRSHVIKTEKWETLVCSDGVSKVRSLESPADDCSESQVYRALLLLVLAAVGCTSTTTGKSGTTATTLRVLLACRDVDSPKHTACTLKPYSRVLLFLTRYQQIRQHTPIQDEGVTVLRIVVSELPFEVAEKLFSEVEGILKATASNNELAATACERVSLLRSTKQRIISSSFQSTEIMANYIDVLIELHNKAIEWQKTGKWGKRWNAIEYQLEFEDLFAKLKRATEDLYAVCCGRSQNRRRLCFRDVRANESKVEAAKRRHRSPADRTA
eukprot:16348-Rhodomonas_salina.1